MSRGCHLLERLDLTRVLYTRLPPVEVLPVAPPLQSPVRVARKGLREASQVGGPLHYDLYCKLAVVPGVQYT